MSNVTLAVKVNRKMVPLNNFVIHRVIMKELEPSGLHGMTNMSHAIPAAKVTVTINRIIVSAQCNTKGYGHSY